MTMFFWARHQIITPCIYWQREPGLTLWGPRWDCWMLMLPVVPSRMCRKISEGFEPASSQPPTADAGFQLFRAFSHFVPAFRKNERARHRPRNYFFSSPLFLSSSFSCWSRNHNYIHLVLPPYLSILASIYLPPHHLATTLFFFWGWRGGGGGEKRRADKY